MSMDTRTGKPVAVQVVKLKKGTVVFELYSKERILGEITNPVFQGGMPGSPSMNGTPVNGVKGDEKGEPGSLLKYGSLCYDRNGVSAFRIFALKQWFLNRGSPSQSQGFGGCQDTHMTRTAKVTLISSKSSLCHFCCCSKIMFSSELPNLFQFATYF